MFNLYPYLNVNDLNLDWIIKHFKEFIDEIESLESWRARHEEEYNELKEFETQLKNGQLPPKMYDAFHDWFVANAFDLVGEMIKHIYFGLSENGHFVAYIPKQWNNIIFKTTEYDYTTPLQTEYGHLCILY